VALQGLGASSLVPHAARRLATPFIRRTAELGFCVLLVGVAEAGEEEYMLSESCTRPYTVINV
jgi:hypothetical protein